MKRSSKTISLRSSAPKDYIIRKLLSSKESVGLNGKPKIIYNYSYHYPNGKRVTKTDEAWVTSLHIPNKINNESLRIYPKGSRVLAEYRDTKNRKIHKYSRKEIRGNVESKFKRVRAFLKSSLEILARIKEDIDPSTKNGQSALILYIISKTGLRVGSNSDTKAETKAYGISTLLNKHISLLPNNKIKFKFIGKKGVLNSSIIQDSIIWNNLSKLKSANWSESIFNVQSSYIRKYLSNIDNRFIIKDFRTLKANEIATLEIDKRKGPAPDEKTFKKWQKEVAIKVAKELGNTVNVALNDYIDPKLWNKWRQPEWGPFIPKKLIDKD